MRAHRQASDAEEATTGLTTGPLLCCDVAVCQISLDSKSAVMLSLPLALRGRFLLSIVVSALVTGLAWRVWGADAGAQSTLLRFWLEDLPPMHGSMRIYIYSALLLTALLSHYARPHLGDSPLQAPELFAYTLPAFFSREGAMQLLHTSAWVNVATLKAIRATTLIAFVMCIIGAGEGHTHIAHPYVQHSTLRRREKRATWLTVLLLCARQCFRFV